MSSKSRAVTIALALAVGLGIPATIAVSTAPSEESQQMIDQQARELDIQMLEEAENGGLAESPAPEPVEPTPTDIPEVEVMEPSAPVEGEDTAEVEPEASESEGPDLTDTRDPEEWEPESAPWQWSQLMEDEDYHMPRCVSPFEAEGCVWVAHENQFKGAAESFIALSPGKTIPLNEDQALAMVGGAIHPAELYATFTTPCEHEDSWGCIWDASVRGNGEGESFWTDLDGNQTLIPHEEARKSLAGEGYNRIWLD